MHSFSPGFFQHSFFRFIHVIACVTSTSSGCWVVCSTRWCHHSWLIQSPVVGYLDSFQLVDVTNKAALSIVNTSLCENTHLHCSGVNTYRWDGGTALQSGFPFPPAVSEDFSCSLFSPTASVTYLSDFWHSNRCVAALYWALNLQFLSEKWWCHHVRGSCAISLSSLSVCSSFKPIKIVFLSIEFWDYC